MTLFYNRNELSDWFELIESLKMDKDKKLTINVFGDSISVGTGSSSTIAGCWEFGYVARIRKRLKEIFQDTGRNVIPAAYLWVYTGTWNTWETDLEHMMGRNYYKGERSPDYGFMGGSKQTDEENATATLTFYGTGLDLYMQQTTDSGTVNISIDGGTATPHDLEGTTDEPVKISFTGLTDGTHTITLTKTNDTKMIYLLGASEIKGTYGVKVNNMSLGGSEIRNIESQNLELMASPTLFNADLTIINIVSNSYLTNTIANFLTKLDTLITAATATGNVLVVLQYKNLSTALTNYNAAILNHCVANNIPVIDTYTEMNGDRAFSIDGIHPNIAGHKLEGDYVLSMILPDSMRYSGLTLKANSQVMDFIEKGV